MYQTYWTLPSVSRTRGRVQFLTLSSRCTATLATVLPRPCSLFLPCKRSFTGLEREREINALSYCRYELPGMAVLREYDHGIHNFLNLKVFLSILTLHLSGISMYLHRITFCTCQFKTLNVLHGSVIMKRRVRLYGLMEAE